MPFAHENWNRVFVLVGWSSLSNAFFFPFYLCVRKFSEMIPSFPCFYPNSRWVESKCNQMSCFIVTSLVPTHLYYIYGIMSMLRNKYSWHGFLVERIASVGRKNLVHLFVTLISNKLNIRFLLNEFIRNLNIVALYSRYFAFFRECRLCTFHENDEVANESFVFDGNVAYLNVAFFACFRRNVYVDFARWNLGKQREPVRSKYRR